MISSRGVGGSIGVGWVIIRLLKRVQRAVKFYAIKICKSVVQLLHVWMPASNLSMPIYNAKRFSACWAGLGVQLVSLRCLVIVEEWSIDFSLVKGMDELLYKYCRGFVSRGITMQPFGVSLQ